MRRLLIIIIAALVLAVIALCYFGFWIPNEPSRARYPVRGIDVSHHQGDINWKAVAASGIRFAYIKATEGADFKDVDFDDNWSGARAAKIVPGAYHFYTFQTAPHSQANNFMAAVPQEKQILPPAIDLELSGYNTTHSVPVNEFQNDFVIFFGILEAVYHQTPVIYTTPEFAGQYLNGMHFERFWVREVFKGSLTVNGQPWMFWQFSERGRVHGISGYADLDVFRGDRSEFEALQLKR